MLFLLLVCVFGANIIVQSKAYPFLSLQRAARSSYVWATLYELIQV